MNITFLYPSKKVGSVQFLFVKMARELSLRDDVNIFVVDFEDGFLKKQLEDEKRITILPFVNDSVSIDFETNIITPLSNLAQCEYLVKGRREQFSFFFWAIQPDNLIGPFSRRKYFLHNLDKVKRDIGMLSEHGVILYMDSNNYLSVRSAIGHKFEPVYLPMPVAMGEKNNLQGAGWKERNEINIGWLGRVSEDKEHTIINIAEQIKLMSSENDLVFHFHLIGKGASDDMLCEYLENSGIRYTLAGTLAGEELNRYIQSIDLGMAMGASSLEFAIRRIPVLLLDHSNSKYPRNIKYNWLFETEGYSLGSDIKHKYHRKHSFSEIIGLYLCDREKIARKCYEYAKHSHDIKTVGNKLYLVLKNGQNMQVKKVLERVFKYLNPRVYKVVYNAYTGLRRRLR